MDEEKRISSEKFGLFVFAWWPHKCRNGKWRWFRSLEKHDDGSYTLGNRAN